MWLQRLLSDPASECSGNTRFCNVLLFLCVYCYKLNLTRNVWKTFLVQGKSLPEFWYKILDEWFATRYISGTKLNPVWSAVLQLPLVYNCAFRFSLRTKRNYDHLKELGIETVEQFLRKKRQFPNDKIVTSFVRSCPTHWLTIDVDSITLQQTLFQGVVCQKWTVEQIYKKLVELKYYDIEPAAISSWQAQFPVTLDSNSICNAWKQACCASPRIKNPKLRSFHLSFLNRMYTCNNGFKQNFS